MDNAETAPSSPTGPEQADQPAAGPSAPAAPRRIYNRKPKAKRQAGIMPADAQHKSDGSIVAYTTAFVPGLYNVKNPPGDFMQKESNIEVFHQQSVARLAKEKEEAKEKNEAAKGTAEEPNGTVNGAAESEKEEKKENPLSNILVIHPGSRNLRLGRASDFYPHEVPNCIARPATAAGGFDPPQLGKRNAEESVGDNIGYLRDYLRNKLRANKLVTDWRDGTRVNASNAKARPEPLPEHQDPYRIDWTEVNGRDFIVGTEALRLAESSGFRIRYPILQRRFNSRDWASLQLLLDDLTIILQESLRTELDIKPIDYKNYSVVLVIPDYGDRVYVQEMANILINVMGFKEIAVHQESYCALFSAGMSSACVVDVGAQVTSITCVEEGMVNPDTRVNLNYGGDDVTVALTALLQRASFPYKELDLSRAQDWIMMDNLKIRICTLEEHLVANTPWDFYVVGEGLTQKYLLRTYDENILAPLCFFDTRMIDFETKLGDSGEAFQVVNPNVTDLIKSSYDEPTSAMKALCSHLFPTREGAGVEVKEDANGLLTPASRAGTPAPAGTPAATSPAPTMTPAAVEKTHVTLTVPPTANVSASATPAPDAEGSDDTANIEYEASKTPLDGAVAASISQSASENKVKTAASSILLVGGGSALKGLGPFIEERLPPLLRQRGYPIDHVTIVPPPRGLNARFMGWKGASVMCNLESLSDMWIQRDEIEALGARALKDRCLML